MERLLVRVTETASITLSAVPDGFQPVSEVASIIQSVAAGFSAGNRRMTAAEFSRELVRLAILNGDLPGGTRLGLADVAEALDVSTTPVREAFRELASEGLIQLDAYRGGTVPELARGDLTELERLRQVLEPLAVRAALNRMDDEVLGRAQRLVDAMIAEPHGYAWVDLNREFHKTLYEPADSPRLIAIIRGLQDQMVMYVSRLIKQHPDRRREANAEHARLLEAFRERDTDRAIEITLAHMALRLEPDVVEVGAETI